MAKHAPRFLKLAEDARANVREVSVQDVKRKIDHGQAFHLVDVREESEWAAGHLPRAVHLGRGVLERDVEQRIDPGLNRPFPKCIRTERMNRANTSFFQLGKRLIQELLLSWRCLL